MATLNLYHVSAEGRLIRQQWDVYSEFVVCAASEDEARRWHPGGAYAWDSPTERWCSRDGHRRQDREMSRDWVSASNLNQLAVALIGSAAPGLEAGVVVASFHAG